MDHLSKKETGTGLSLDLPCVAAILACADGFIDDVVHALSGPVGFHDLPPIEYSPDGVDGPKQKDERQFDEPPPPTYKQLPQQPVRLLRGGFIGCPGDAGAAEIFLDGLDSDVVAVTFRAKHDNSSYHSAAWPLKIPS
jgi:hypothetical protein